jgi:hypothetical protein
MTCNNKIAVEGGRKKVNCGSSRSCRTNTWFSHSQLTLHESLVFVYLWWIGEGNSQIEEQLALSPQTVVDWSSFCRDVAIEVVFNNSEPIGGPDKEVEIDESKLGNSKQVACATT